MGVVVIYHAACQDGFCCAWLLSKVYPDATFLPAQYGDAPPPVGGQDVIIADFSYKRPIMEKIIAEAKSVVVLDHHKTAQAELAGLSDPKATILFDMEKSGGRLTWEWIDREIDEIFTIDHGKQFMVDYTEDRDLWRHDLAMSEEINAFIRSYPMDFDDWDYIAEHSKQNVDKIIVEGMGILRYQEKIVTDQARKAVRATFLGFSGIPVMNATVLISEIGNALCQSAPFSATYFDTAEKRVWSLRSAESGEDVSKVAAAMGGGGHPHAAGFTQALGQPWPGMMPNRPV